MALKAGYVGVKRWLYEKIVKDVIDIWTNVESTGVINLIENTAASTEKNDTVYTVNADGTISLSGTASETNNVTINAITGAALKKLGSKLYLSGGCSSKVYLILRTTNWTEVAKSEGSEVSFNTSGLTDATTYTLSVVVTNGTNTAGMVVKPMITNKAGLVYAPYAMTNRQLTKAYEIANKTGVTFNDTYCDVSGCSYSLSVKGNLAQIIGVVKITTQVPQYTKFIEGLPAVKSSGGAAFNFALLSSADGTKTYRCYLDSYGKISAHVTPIPAGSYVLSFVYFCAEDTAIYTRSLDREASPEVIADDPEPVTKTTRSTKKTATTKEGE